MKDKKRMIVNSVTMHFESILVRMFSLSEGKETEERINYDLLM